MRTQVLGWVLALSFFLCAGTAVAWAADGDGHYRVMPGDSLAVSVFQYDELSGKFPIDAVGSITMPVVGEIKVVGMTLESCQNAIKAALTKGYLVDPVVSVRIDEYRPIYVYGQVKAPGVYSYRTGMTAISAIVVAGGAPNYTSETVLATDLVSADERASVLSAKRLESLVDIAGLQSLSSERSDVDLSMLPPDAKGVPGLDDLVKRERIQIGIAFAGHHAELDLLRKQIPQFDAEHEALKSELDVQRRLIDLLKKRRQELQDLAKNGLTHASAVVDLEQQVALAEGEFARLKSSISHSELDQSSLELKIAEKENLFNQLTLQQLGDARRNLTEITIELANALKTRDLRREAAGFVGTVATTNSFVIYRKVDGQQQTIQATAVSPVEPGDMIEVTTTEASAAADAGPSPNQPRGSPVLFAPDLPVSRGTSKLLDTLRQQ